MAESEQAILLRASAGKNAFTLKFIGLVSLTITILFFAGNDFKHHLVITFFLLLSMLLFFVGYLKSQEPKHSYVLTRAGINYQHKYGKLFIPWHSIKRMNQLVQQDGLSQRPLPYIGITLDDIETVSAHISPRLAARLIHEQRDLYVAKIIMQGIKLDVDAINLSPYKCRNGYNITGPIACWLHRSLELKQSLGFHIYLPINSFDCEPAQFIKLLKECKTAAMD